MFDLGQDDSSCLTREIWVWLVRKVRAYHPHVDLFHMNKGLGAVYVVIVGRDWYIVFALKSTTRPTEAIPRDKIEHHFYLILQSLPLLVLSEEVCFEFFWKLTMLSVRQNSLTGVLFSH